MNTLPLAISLAALSTLASASIWETATFQVTCSTNARAQDASGTVTVTKGGIFPAALIAPPISFAVDSQLPGGGRAFAYSDASHGFMSPGVFSLSGYVLSQLTPMSSMTAARAEAHSGYSIQFEVPGDAMYRFAFAYLSTGVVASIHDEFDALIASFDGVNNQPVGQSGFLAAGSYRFEITADATSELTLGDVYAAKIYGLILLIGPAACSSDLNSDWQVDDADFGIFAVGYDILDCNDASMPVVCQGDLNGDYVVDDADFIVFIAAYEALACP